MSELLISILITTAATMVILPLIRGPQSVFSKSDSQSGAEPYTPPNPEILNCRVRLVKERNNGSISDAFSLEICGTIRAPSGCDCAMAYISISDVTDGANKALPVQTTIEKWQVKSTNAFCHISKLGRLPDKVTTLSDWMSVAAIPTDCLTFAQRGKRNLKFKTSILSHQNSTELACATCNFTYENPSLGYIELEENIQQAKIMAVSLALVVAAADKKISAHDVEVIQNWTKNNIAAPAADRFFTIFNKLSALTFAFFPRRNRIHCRRICEKIAQIAPAKVRSNIMELCLRIVGSNGTITAGQLVLLKNIADWFEINREKFRYMAENTLPVSMYRVEDFEISLGISSDMDNDQICHQLSQEYRKWNARTTNRNPEVETQADHMLQLIGQLRNRFAG